MCTFFTHAFSAVIAGKLAFTEKMPKRFWFGAMLCASISDADVIGFKFGIKYEDLFGHRGFSHSFVFALVLAVLVMFSDFKSIKRNTKKWWKLFLFFFFIVSSHGILDAMTDGGLGIAFFSPFDSTRYFLPWRPIAVPPIGVIIFFSELGVRTLMSEFLLVWLPLLTIWGITSFLRIRKTTLCGRNSVEQI